MIRRCLTIVRRVQRGPAQWQELIQSVYDQEGSEAYGGVQGKALRRRLENDLARIRQELMIDLYYDRQARGYTISDVWLPLFDLPDEDLATIAWLHETFGHDSPQHDEDIVTVPAFQDQPPEFDRVSAYDEQHLAHYIRLLDAEAEGADWHEAVSIIFGIDPDKEPDRAKLVYDSHLARAHWMTQKGYRDLLEPPTQ